MILVWVDFRAASLVAFLFIAAPTAHASSENTKALVIAKQNAC